MYVWRAGSGLRTSQAERAGAQSTANQSIRPELSQLSAASELGLTEQLRWLSQLILTEHFSKLSDISTPNPVSRFLIYFFPLLQLLHPPKLFPWSCHFQNCLLSLCSFFPSGGVKILALQ